MEHEHDNDMQDMIDEFAEDLNRSRNRDEDFQHTENMSSLSFREKPFLWGSIGLIFLISVFALFSNGNDDSLEKEINLISDRLGQIEQKIDLMEGDIKEKEANQSGINTLRKSLSKLENSGKSVQGQVNDLTKKINKLEKELTSVQAERKNQSTVNIAPKKSEKMITHTVRKGDTLYRISQKYNVQVNEIQRLNNLKDNQDIFPGQELVISK